MELISLPPSRWFVDCLNKLKMSRDFKPHLEMFTCYKIGNCQCSWNIRYITHLKIKIKTITVAEWGESMSRRQINNPSQLRLIGVFFINKATLKVFFLKLTLVPPIPTSFILYNQQTSTLYIVVNNMPTNLFCSICKIWQKLNGTYSQEYKFCAIFF
jgi:hypothetical protein